MLEEQRNGKTHISYYLPTQPYWTCLCTVRVEYAEAVKAAIEAQITAAADKVPA